MECVVLLESCLQKNSTIRLPNIRKFDNGKIHVNKKLFTLEVILRTFFFIFTSSCIVTRQKILQQGPNIGGLERRKKLFRNFQVDTGSMVDITIVVHPFKTLVLVRNSENSEYDNVRNFQWA